MKKIFHSFFDVHLCPPPTLRKVPPPLFGVQSHGELKIKTCQLPPFLQPHRKRQESTPCYTGVLASSYQTPCTIHLVCGFFFVVWASSFHPLLGRTIDLEAAVEQPFDCLIVRNRQAVQSMGRSMDWTLEDNMVDGLFFWDLMLRDGLFGSPPLTFTIAKRSICLQQGYQIFFTWGSQTLFWKEPTWKSCSQTPASWWRHHVHSTIVWPFHKIVKR